jgi:serine/threonine-protein kinase
MVRAAETLAGRYELVEVIGQGGMGVVYRGRDRILDRTVAVKVLPALYAENPTLVERFEREARAAARLSHPNIVSVYDSGRDGTVRYIVMECVPGASLAEILARSAPLPIPQAVEIAARVADALAAAHAAGIVHRDVKPGNVMVLPTGAVKVLDFGIARAAADAALTRTTMVLGSAPYIAPEVALGQSADARSDIYSLGCVLYEMLTGRPPFLADLPAAVMNQHTSVPPRPPRELETGIPASLEALVMRMLAKPPEARPQPAASVAPALRASLNDPPQTAPTEAMIAPPQPSPRAPTHAPVGPTPPPRAEPPRQAKPPTEATLPPRRSGRRALLILLSLLVALAVGVAIALAVSSGSGPSSSSSHCGQSQRTSGTTSAPANRQTTGTSKTGPSTTRATSTSASTTSTTSPTTPTHRSTTAPPSTTAPGTPTPP